MCAMTNRQETNKIRNFNDRTIAEKNKWLSSFVGETTREEQSIALHGENNVDTVADKTTLKVPACRKRETSNQEISKQENSA